MRKFYCLSAMILIVLFIAVPALADEKKRSPSAVLKIGLSEAYNPQPGFTLADKYSKLKTALENEFGADVQSVTSNWGNLSSYDVFIIPCRFQVEAPAADATALLNWVQNGGCLIVLWYPMHLGSGQAGTDRDWGGRNLSNITLLNGSGLVSRATPASSNIMTSFVGPFNSNPYSVSTVTGDVKTGWLIIEGGGKNLAWSGGQLVAAYNDNVGQGQTYMLGNLYAFQDNLIDAADNKDFIFNIIHYYLGSDGGGNGGTPEADLYVKKIKSKHREYSPGDQIVLITRIKNKSNVATPATDVTFYFSPDKQLDASDILIDSTAVPALAKRKSKKIKKTFLLPLALAAGDYYVIAIVDEAEAVPDKNRDNNAKAYNKTIEIL